MRHVKSFPLKILNQKAKKSVLKTKNFVTKYTHTHMKVCCLCCCPCFVINPFTVSEVSERASQHSFSLTLSCCCCKSFSTFFHFFPTLAHLPAVWRKFILKCLLASSVIFCVVIAASFRISSRVDFPCLFLSLFLPS